MSHPAPLRSLLTLFLISGALGLGYQVLWSKIVLHFVGVSSWSYGIVLAAFMGGLAIGARFLGRLADRVASPLALFGWLEICVGLYAIAYPSLANALGAIYQQAVMASGAEAGGLGGIAVKALLAGLLLLPPTILMGATYPAMLRHATPRLALVGRRASGLYSINALGAVLGAIGMAFLMIPALGLRGSLMLLALGNALIGLAALVMARREGPLQSADASEPAEDAGNAPESAAPLSRARTSVLLLLLFAAGTLSFTCELAWTRLFSMVLGSSTYSFAIIVATFIAGIALGAGILARVEHRVRDPLAALGWSQVSAATLIVVTLPALQFLPWLFGRVGQGLPPTTASLWQFEATKVALCAAVMLPPALLMGLCIPLAVKACARDLAGLATDAGRVHAANTSGNVVGALAAALVLLPWLGVESLLRVVAVLLAVVGVGALLLAAAEGSRRLASRAIPALVVVTLLATLLPRWNPAWFTLVPFRRDPMPSFTGARATVEARNVLLFEDDAAANIAIIEQDGEDGLARALLINGKPDASSLGDMPTQLLLGHLPLLLHGDAKSALVVGLASGVTSGAILRHDVERLDVVDIVQRMPAASRYFDAWSGAPLDDPRMRVIIDDARAYLSTTRHRYDVIISEPSNPWISGIGSLFAREHFERARQALSPGGVYCQWLQFYELSDATLLAIIATFRAEFPHVLAFAVNRQDLLLIGSLEDLQLDAPAALARSPAGVRESLVSIGLEDPLQLSFLQCWSQATVDWLAAASPVLNTDDNLLLEHEAPRDLFMGAQPTWVADQDERLVASPTLPWARAVRSGADATMAPRLMALQRLGSPALHVASLAALADLRGGVDALDAELLTGTDRGSFNPASGDRLLEVLRAVVAAEDWAQLERFARAERPGLAQRAMMSADAAQLWASELGRQAEAGGPVARRVLGPLRAEILAASGRGAEARAQLEALLPLVAPAHLALIACRLDAGAGCDAFLALALERGPSPHLSRLHEIRSASAAP